jgi:hypothetical protein
MFAAAATDRTERKVVNRKSKKYTVYVYPDRNPAYAEFVTKYPQEEGSLNPVKQSAMRKIVFEAFADAKEEFDTWQLQREADPNTPLLIPNITGSTRRTNRPYTVYLNKEDIFHRPITEYVDALTPSNRQLFFNLLFVRGMNLPDVELFTRGL